MARSRLHRYERLFEEILESADPSDQSVIESLQVIAGELHDLNAGIKKLIEQTDEIWSINSKLGDIADAIPPNLAGILKTIADQSES